MREASRLEREWATQVFLSLISDGKARLERGAKLRQKMYDELKSGKNPTGYRPQWIRSAARKLVQALADSAGEFNRDHPHDQASVLDLLDVLSTATNMLNSAAQEVSEGKPDPTKPKPSA